MHEDDEMMYASLLRTVIEGAAAAYREMVSDELQSVGTEPELLTARAKWFGFTEHLAILMRGHDHALMYAMGFLSELRVDPKDLAEMRQTVQGVTGALRGYPPQLPEWWFDTFLRLARNPEGPEAEILVTRLLDVPDDPPTPAIIRIRAKIYHRLVIPMWLLALERLEIDTTQLRDEWFPRI